MIAPSRRGFLRGMGVLIAAPAIVRAASLMPVRALAPSALDIYGVSAAFDHNALLAALLEQRIVQAAATMRAAIEHDLYETGTIGGLQALDADPEPLTIGGISTGSASV